MEIKEEHHIGVEKVRVWESKGKYDGNIDVDIQNWHNSDLLDNLDKPIRPVV